jgi:hypothetical protein
MPARCNKLNVNSLTLNIEFHPYTPCSNRFKWRVSPVDKNVDKT